MVVVYAGSFQAQFWSSLTGEPDIDGKGDGIYRFEMDKRDGTLTPLGHMPGVISPGALCLSPDKKYLYAASDTRDFINGEAGTGGGVYAFGVDPRDGALKYIGQRSSCGVRAVDIRCDYRGEFVLAVNCGSIFCSTSFSKGGDGRYRPEVRHDEGCVTLFSVDGGGFAQVCDRYVLPEGAPAHPHGAYIDGDDNVFVANGGGDTVDVLRLDRAQRKLLPLAAVRAEKGGSPRRVATHPGLPVLYCLHGENAAITAYLVDEKTGALKPMQTASAAPEGFRGPWRAADMQVSPDGRFLYACGYGQPVIAAFSLDGRGMLTPLQHFSDGLAASGGFAVRSLAVDPSGRFLLAADLGSDAIVTLGIDAGTGRLSYIGRTASPSPAGLCFAVL